MLLRKTIIVDGVIVSAFISDLNQVVVEINTTVSTGGLCVYVNNNSVFDTDHV